MRGCSRYLLLVSVGSLLPWTTSAPQLMTDNAPQDDTVTTDTGSIAGLSRRTLLKAGAVTGSAFALSSSVSAGEGQEDDPYEDEPSVAYIRIPYLDLDTLEAEFEGETLQAESYADGRPGSTTYVGEVIGRPGPALFAGVSLLDDTDRSDEDGQSGIVAYLCNGEPGALGKLGLHFVGDYDAGGVTLTPKDAEDVAMKVALVDGEFLGAVTLPDGESFPFLATEATDDAGIYWTEVDPEEETSVRWVVLPDGRQRGDACWQCCDGTGCYVCCCAPGHCVAQN